MRLPITQLIAQTDADLPDNNLELITPAILRQVLTNFAESMAPVTSLLGGSPLVPVAQVLSTVPAKLATGVYSVALSGNPAVWEARLAQEDMLCKTTVGRAFVTFNVTFTAANGVDVAFTLARNGAPLVFRSVQTGRGAANQISAEFSWVFETLAVNDTFELYVAALTGAPTLNIYNAAIKTLLLSQYS